MHDFETHLARLGIEESEQHDLCLAFVSDEVMRIFSVTRYDTYDKLKRGLTNTLENLTRLSQNLSNNPQETTDQFGSRARKLQKRMGLVVKNPLPGDPKVLLKQAALVCSEEAVIRRLLFNCHPE